MLKKSKVISVGNENIKKDEKVLKDLTEPETRQDSIRHNLKDFLNNFKIHKSRSKKEPVKANPKILFFILAGICIVLIILSAMFEEVAYPFKTAASAIVIPAQSGINYIGSWIADKTDILHSMEELSEENAQLKKTIEELRTDNTQLRQQDDEVEQLRDLLNLQSEYSEYETTAAKIVSKDSSKWFSTFTLNKGSNDGIEKNMNVVASGGLVGVVTDVGLNFCTVRTIINDSSNVSAMFENGTDLCVVSGNLASMENNTIDFSDASISVSISEGDAVVTSYVSSIYLPGLLIGYVSDYSVDGNELTQSGHITPVVDFESLSEVLIINKLKETSD